MLEHADLKLVHLTCVVASITGFSLRGGLMLAGSALIWNPWVRTLPHFVDTLLLVSGLWMAMNLQQYPGTAGWLTAKLVALVVYVVLGAVALRYGKTHHIRVWATAGALGTFGYMAAVAVYRDPWLGLIS